jgi:hypothetical protein
MFLRGFMCGWIAMAVIVAVLVWGMTPRDRSVSQFSPDKPGYDMGYDRSSC